jgi:hypothetical protein
MPQFIIRCPRTASTVDVWVPQGTSDTKPDEYEAVTCPACIRLHFVHKITGKLLGETSLLDSVMGVPRSRWPSRGH